MKDVDRLFEDEPTPPELPPPPVEPDPLPMPKLKIRGVDAEVWAGGVERELTAGRQRTFDAEQGIRTEIESLGRYVRDGFDLFGKQLLPTVKKIEEGQDRVERRMDELQRAVVAIGERHNEIVDRQDAQDAEIVALKQRVTALETKAQRPKKRAGKKK